MATCIVIRKNIHVYIQSIYIFINNGNLLRLGGSNTFRLGDRLLNSPALDELFPLLYIIQLTANIGMLSIMTPQMQLITVSIIKGLVTLAAF